MSDAKTPTELNRVTAEKGREEAEDLRETADHERGSAEEHRAVAESSRTEAERFRVLAEEANIEPFTELDLSAEIHRLHAETIWSTGQNARTLIKHDDLRVVLIALAAEARIKEHKANGRVSIHVLSGHVQLRASGRTFNLRAGELLALDGDVPHDVHALEESALLLTIASPGRK